MSWLASGCVYYCINLLSRPSFLTYLILYYHSPILFGVLFASIFITAFLLSNSLYCCYFFQHLYWFLFLSIPLKPNAKTSAFQWVPDEIYRCFVEIWTRPLEHIQGCLRTVVHMEAKIQLLTVLCTFIFVQRLKSRSLPLYYGRFDFITHRRLKK